MVKRAEIHTQCRNQILSKGMISSTLVINTKLKNYEIFHIQCLVKECIIFDSYTARYTVTVLKYWHFTKDGMNNLVLL